MSGNIFQEVLTNAAGVEAKLLGPSYPYWKNIKSPSEIGMSDEGTLDALGNDVSGLVSYVELLVTGKSNASATGGPLGNKFFLQTGGQCKSHDGKLQDRFIYVNNVPLGNIPFISAGMGTNFSEFRGLIPGIMSDLNVLNPYGIMSAFLSGTTPDCYPLTMEVIDNNNNKSSATKYVTISDISNMDPCSFPNGENPLPPKKRCKNAFTQLSDLDNETTMNYKMNKQNKTRGNQLSPCTTIYFVLLGIFIIYIMTRLS